ncbi:MAG: carboxylating nicotinate-nucleotide diphosphorylase [Planctomycetes bacterium]|nr:carboxylating nicotinate-nucleotide diphosphorylase [Planctomycetota bacterium]
MTEADTELESFWTEHAADVDARLRSALAEDRVDHDAATEIAFGRVSAGPQHALARITAGECGVVAGVPGAFRAFALLDSKVRLIQRRAEGAAVDAGDVVLELVGTIPAVLGAERTALNWLGYLSGIATRTADWVARAPGVAILDTRKTLPGWRDLAKYAVRAGGGTNHRRDLSDFPMLKENHRDLFRNCRMSPESAPDEEIRALVERHRESAWSHRPLEIEVEDYDSLRACVEHGVDWILIDNQSPETIREWVARVEADVLGLAPDWRGRLEASGGITGRSIAAYAAAGVGRISIGSLTHSVPNLDVSLHVEWLDEESR